MDVFETRSLTFIDDKGKTQDVLLSALMPARADVDGEDEPWWICHCTFDPPIITRVLDRPNPDQLGALESALTLAGILLKAKAHALDGQFQWRGEADCGLPQHRKDPISLEAMPMPRAEPMTEGLRLLGSRGLTYPGEDGNRNTVLLSVFAPFREGDRYKCGINFGAPVNAGVFYGIGEDRIEAFLDALSLARTVYEKSIPSTWPLEERAGCVDFPYKVGRSFRKLTLS